MNCDRSKEHISEIVIGRSYYEYNNLSTDGRGCGSRDEGAMYACCGVQEGGLLIEHFIVDPSISCPRKF